MKVKIQRIDIKGDSGTQTIRPKNKVISYSELENYRKSLMRDESDTVRFQHEEVEEE